MQNAGYQMLFLTGAYKLSYAFSCQKTQHDNEQRLIILSLKLIVHRNADKRYQHAQFSENLSSQLDILPIFIQ